MPGTPHFVGPLGPKSSPFSSQDQSVDSSSMASGLSLSKHSALGRHSGQELRAGAMKGMRLDKAGANAVLHLSLSTNTLLDPGFFLLWEFPPAVPTIC